MLFNAGLESAFRGWQSKLGSQGFLLSTNGKRLTNVRYVDDVMLFAKTAEELIHHLLAVCLTPLYPLRKKR